MKFNKEVLMRSRANEIAQTLKNMIEEYYICECVPDDWEGRSENLIGLQENILEIMKHPRKNKELIYFLRELDSSYKSSSY